jgi:hypothetical protein
MGTAVHTIIEHKIKTGEELEFESVFFPLVREQRKIEKDTTQWLAGGPKDAPFMGQKVVDMGKACVENAFKFLEKMTVYEVEYDASGRLPNLEVPVKAFIDLVGEHEDFGYVVADFKTSASKPKNDLQLRTYSALLRVPPLAGGDHPFTEHGSIQFNGYWAMLRPDAAPKTNKARFVDLSDLDIDELGARYQRAYEKMKNKEYGAFSTFCDFCTQRPNCLAQSGPTERAIYYDKSETDGIPFSDGH